MSQILADGGRGRGHSGEWRSQGYGRGLGRSVFFRASAAPCEALGKSNQDGAAAPFVMFVEILTMTW